MPCSTIQLITDMKVSNKQGTHLLHNAMAVVYASYSEGDAEWNVMILQVLQGCSLDTNELLEDVF